VWGISKFQVPFCVFSIIVAEMGKKKSKKAQRAEKSDSDPDFQMEEEVAEEGADEAQAIKPSYTIPLQAIAHWPVEAQKDIQADADGVWRMQCRIGEEDEGIDRKVRDFLKEARAFLLRIWPAMSIAEAARHPLVNGTQITFFFNFLLSEDRMACFGTGRKAKPCKNYPEFGCNAGLFCRQHKSSHVDVSLCLHF
jgi:hypothetical protein